MNKTTTHIIIVHGWEASASDHWFPWLKEKLERGGNKVSVPTMPDSNNPLLQKWLQKCQEAVGAPSKNTYLVGHSLGVITILRYLETLKEGEIVGGAVFVAGFPMSIGYAELNSFFQNPVDYKAIKKHAKLFIAINSDNDPYVSLNNGELLRDNLGASLVIIKNGGHFNAGDGYIEFPAALEALNRIMTKTA